MNSRLGKARLRVPESAARGEVIEIRSMVEHPMDSGFRYDDIGRRIPRHIVTRFVCRLNGHEVFSATLQPAVSANPYFQFCLLASESGELSFTWTDDRGGSVTEIARLEVI